MQKYLKKIFPSLLIIPMSLIFVSCNAHENSGIVVDGKENSDGVIDYIPESILFKRNARKTVSLLAKTVPSQSKGKIYCYLSENKVLTNDNKSYSVSNLTQSNSDVSITNTPTSGRSAISIVADGSSTTWSKTYYLNFFAVNVDGSVTDLLASCQVDRFENANKEGSFILNVKNATNGYFNDNDAFVKYDDGDYAYPSNSLIMMFKFYDSIADFFNNTSINYKCNITITKKTRILTLTTDFVTYLKENNYSYSKTTINLSNNSLWSNFGELFGLGDNWEGIIEDFCFEHQNKTTIPRQYTPFATYGETIYFNGGSRALSVNLFYVNIWR